MSAIFISHSSADLPLARKLREQLRAAGYESIFLDKDRDDGVTAGEEWRHRLQREVRSCQVMIALVSVTWKSSSWCAFEVNAADALEKVIIPLPLDDTAVPPLSHLHNADVPADSIDDPETFRRVTRALERFEVSKGKLDPARGPYPGLSSFEEEDAGIFFGRQRETASIVQELAGLPGRQPAPWLVLVGASGSGKSSLLRAGVLPALKRDARLPYLVTGAFRRGKDPFEGLSLVLEAAFSKCREQVDAGALKTRLQTGSDASLADLAGELRLAGGRADATVLLAVDQLEECLEKADSRFIALLRRLTTLPHAPFLVLATLRSDFLGAFQNHSELRGRSWAWEPRIVKPVELRELSRVIEEPAVLASVAFESGLVEEIVRDTATEDALPLLGFTLRLLYERHRATGTIRREDYENLGRLQGSVAKKASEVLDTPTDDDDLKAAFLALVQPSDDGQLTRRRALWNDIPASTHVKLQQFVAARLLVSSKSENQESSLEVAHEALFRSWKQLATWIHEHRDLLVWRKRIDPEVRRWLESERATTHLLVGPTLQPAAEQLKNRRRLLSNNEREFIVASVAAERRQKFFSRSMAWVGGLVLLLVTAIAVFQHHKAARLAEEHQRRTEELQRQAERARQQRDRIARREAEAHNFALFSAATRTADPQLRSTFLRETRLPAPPGWLASAAFSSWSAVPNRTLEGHTGRVLAAAFSPDGERIVTGSSDTRARVWNVRTGASLFVLEGHPEPVVSVAFHPTQDRVATASADGSVRIWDASTGKSLRHLDGETRHDPATSISFSDDGTKLMTTSWWMTRVWLDAAARPKSILPAKDGGSVAAISPDGTSVVAVDDTGAVSVRSVDGSGKPVQLHADFGYSPKVAFSPDGMRIAAVTGDGTVLAWPLHGKDKGKPRKLGSHQGLLQAIQFSPDGRTLLTASGSGDARLWSVDDFGQASTLSGHSKAITSVAFSPNGKQVVTGSNDRTARVWSVDDRHAPLVLEGHIGSVVAVAFSPNGQHVVTASNDETARIWNAGGTGEPRVLTHHPRQVELVQFTTDGKRVFTASGDGTLHQSSTDGTVKPRVVGETLQSRSSVYALSPDGKWFLTPGRRRKPELWDVERAESVLELPPRGAIGAAAFRHDGKELAIGWEDGSVETWNVSGNPSKRRDLKGDGSRVHAIVYSHDGKSIAFKSASGDVLVQPSDGSKPPIMLGKSQARISALAFSPDSTHLAVGRSDHSALIWSVGGEHRTIVLRGHTDEVSSVHFSPNGDRVLTGSHDTTARLWEVSEGRLLHVFKGHQDAVLNAWFSPDGLRMLTISNDRTARLSNADGKGEPVVLAAHGDRLWSAAFSPDSKQIVTGTQYGTVLAWKIDEGDVRAALWRLLAPCPSLEQRTRQSLSTEPEAVKSADAQCNATLEACKQGVAACRTAVAGQYEVLPSVDTAAQLR